MTVCTNGQVILEEKYERCRFTKPEIISYARWLGINLKREPELYPLVYEGIKAPLPVGWKPCMNTNGDIYYFNFFTGQSTWDHPCDVYYKNMVLEYRKNKSCTNVTDRKQKYFKRSLHKKSFGPCHGIKLLHIETYNKSTSNQTQNNGTSRSNINHIHNLKLSNEHPVSQNLSGTENEPLVNKLKPSENSDGQFRKSTGVQYESPRELQAIPSREKTENSKNQTELALVSQVDENLLNFSLLSNSEDFTNSIRFKTLNVAKSYGFSETVQDEMNSINCYKTKINQNMLTGYSVYERSEESINNENTDICNSDISVHNHLQTKTGSDCMTKLLKKMEQNHEEVLGASYKLCSMQNELVSWCNEIEKRLYDIDSRYKITFCRNRVLRGDNDLRIFLEPREVNQQDYVDTSLYNKATCNEYLSYNSNLSNNTKNKRPHSSDDYLLRSEKHTCTETKMNAISTNSLVSKTNHNENLVPISSSRSQNLVRHLSIVDISKPQYTVTNWNRLSSDWNTVRTKLYHGKFLYSPKNLPQSMINQQLEDYSRWLEQAEAYMKTLQSV
uniref:WW domain-containing protein n=2 Tax=Schistosoma mansoni TaxID=6183 RepID=A0A3Q0KMM8_SCHMA